MAHPYRPKVTDGYLNPKCNQFSGAEFASSSIPSTKEVAAEANRRKAAEEANREAYKRALEASKRQTPSEPKRWLSNEDLK